MTAATSPVPAARKRTVETGTEFDAFARRILRAYGRRVADGDVEALRSLAELAAELDAVTRLAVIGLRQEPYAYSWAEIADRLGVTRQAAQMRFGEKATRTDRLDQRLIDGGLAVSVAVLAAIYADHHAGTPTPSTCPGCGFRYPDGTTDCPTMTTVRPLLYRRRAEDKAALASLTPDQFTNLHRPSATRNHRAALRPAATRVTPSAAPTLFDLHNGEDSTS